MDTDSSRPDTPETQLLEVMLAGVEDVAAVARRRGMTAEQIAAWATSLETRRAVAGVRVLAEVQAELALARLRVHAVNRLAKLALDDGVAPETGRKAAQALLCVNVERFAGRVPSAEDDEESGIEQVGASIRAALFGIEEDDDDPDGGGTGGPSCNPLNGGRGHDDSMCSGRHEVPRGSVGEAQASTPPRPRGDAHHGAAIRQVFGDHRPGPDGATLAEGDPRKHFGPEADERSAADGDASGQGGGGGDVDPVAKCAVVLDDRARVDQARVADLGVGADHRQGPDVNPAAKRGALADDRPGVDHVDQRSALPDEATVDRQAGGVVADGDDEVGVVEARVVGGQQVGGVEVGVVGRGGVVEKAQDGDTRNLGGVGDDLAVVGSAEDDQRAGRGGPGVIHTTGACALKPARRRGSGGGGVFRNIGTSGGKFLGEVGVPGPIGGQQGGLAKLAAAAVADQVALGVEIDQKVEAQDQGQNDQGGSREAQAVEHHGDDRGHDDEGKDGQLGDVFADVKLGAGTDGAVAQSALVVQGLIPVEGEGGPAAVGGLDDGGGAGGVDVDGESRSAEVVFDVDLHGAGPGAGDRGSGAGDRVRADRGSDLDRMIGMNEDRHADDSPIRLTRKQASAVDRYAIDVLKLPGVVLMENAGINAAAVVMDVLRGGLLEADDGLADWELPGATVAIVCGGGNNGGDGYVVARQLMGWGVSPVVYAVKRIEELRGDAAVNAGAWQKLGGAVVPAWDEALVQAAAGEWAACHVVVDAILGTGFGVEKGEVRGAAAAAIGAMNQLTPGSGARVVALDLPSGLDADTGQAVGDAVRADLTVTFVAEKAGFGTVGVGDCTGKIVIADIGLPESAVAAALSGMDGGEP